MLTRYVLPVALFVLVVGAVAWVAQSMPSWRTPAQATVVVPTTQMVQFVRTKAVWDKNDAAYVREAERGASGQYDFPFRNNGDQPAELGLLSKSCDCTEVQIALLPAETYTAALAVLKEDPSAEPKMTLDWQPLPPSETQGVKLDPGQGGLVRVTWTGRRNLGDRLNLKQRLWAQTAGQLSSRQVTDLEVPVLSAPPVYFSPDSQFIGNLGVRDVGRAEFHVWSATRDKVNLRIGDKKTDPLLVIEQRELPLPEREALQKQLREQGATTRIRTAYEVKVTVHEQKDGKEMDQGPFTRKLPLFVDDELLDNVGPLLSGYVKSDVKVGTPEEQGKIQLRSFATSDGMRKTVAVVADAKLKLEPATQEPAYLQVKLTRKDKATQEARWQLEVTVPPHAAVGPLPDDAAVVLRITGATTRLVRIPVVGNGTAGP